MHTARLAAAAVAVPINSAAAVVRRLMQLTELFTYIYIEIHTPEAPLTTLAFRS